MAQPDVAKSRTNWLAQFGLYRDDGEEKKPSNKSWKPTVGLYMILGCSILLILAVFFILQELFAERQEIIEFPSFDRPTIFPTESSFNTTEEWTNTSVDPKIGENMTEIVSEKLVHSPSKFLKPPPPPRETHRRSIQPPRPFEFELHEPHPSAFQKPNVTVSRVNNIQDILQQLREPPDPGSSRIRRNTERSFDFTTSAPDPFFNYKPHAPSDINLMATKQFRFAPYLYKTSPGSRGNQHPAFYHYATESSGDISSIYQDLITADKNRGKLGGSRDENQNNLKKPFSLMLDIYPVKDEEEYKTSPSLTRKPYVNGLDTSSYYSTMNFPQIPQNHQTTHSVYHNMYYRGPFGTTRDHHWVYPDPIPTEDTINKPSQMIVHLNLYPKNKKRLGRIDSAADKRASSNEENTPKDTFQPIRPKVFYNSRPLDEQEDPDLGIGTAVEIPKTITPYSSTTIYYPNSTSYVEIVRSVDLTPSSTPSPYPGNRPIVVYPKSEHDNHPNYLHPRATLPPEMPKEDFTFTSVSDESKVHNSQQPDNPMVVRAHGANKIHDPRFNEEFNPSEQFENFDVPPRDLIRFDSRDAIQMH
uniref:Uncharacterized protein n=1 Tax=Phlebotomus papatasi TaxID=29031 RepID=A0A1B0D200_PHLPP